MSSPNRQRPRRRLDVGRGPASPCLPRKKRDSIASRLLRAALAGGSLPMWAHAVLVVLLLIEPTSAQSPPVVPYPRDYKTNLVKYAVVDHADGMSRDLYASRAVIEALKRDPRLQEFPVGGLFALDVYSE